MNDIPSADKINFDEWLRPDGPVALTLKQRLLPVEGEGGVIFPPTYADIGYNVNTMPDGTKRVTIDSIPSQANRMEGALAGEPYRELLPDVRIKVQNKEVNVDGKEETYFKQLSLLVDMAHRAADAAVHSCPELAKLSLGAFGQLKRFGDASRFLTFAPTTLVFGAWDSRGRTQEKLPRLIKSDIIAHDVAVLYSASQYTSIIKKLSEDDRTELEKFAKANNKKLSNIGLDDAPSTFRKVSDAAEKEIKKFKDGTFNPERHVLGGIVANGPIERTLTLNLIALRRLHGRRDATETDWDSTSNVQRYVLGLSLIAAAAEPELFLRSGCLLRIAEDDQWHVVPRRGAEAAVDLSSRESIEAITRYASSAASRSRPHWKSGEFEFSLAAAKKLIAAASESEAS